MKEPNKIAILADRIRTEKQQKEANKYSKILSNVLNEFETTFASAIPDLCSANVEYKPFLLIRNGDNKSCYYPTAEQTFDYFPNFPSRGFYSQVAGIRFVYVYGDVMRVRYIYFDENYPNRQFIYLTDPLDNHKHKSFKDYRNELILFLDEKTLDDKQREEFIEEQELLDLNKNQN